VVVFGPGITGCIEPPKTINKLETAGSRLLPDRKRVRLCMAVPVSEPLRAMHL
jgi:hypothetical protein